MERGPSKDTEGMINDLNKISDELGSYMHSSSRRGGGTGIFSHRNVMLWLRNTGEISRVG